MFGGGCRLEGDIELTGESAPFLLQKFAVRGGDGVSGVETKSLLEIMNRTIVVACGSRIPYSLAESRVGIGEGGFGLATLGLEDRRSATTSVERQCVPHH